MSDMSVTLAGVKMRTPIGVQPTAPLAPWMFDPERYAAWILRSVDAGAGYVYVPACFHSAELEKDLSEMKRKKIPIHLPGQRLMKMETPGFGVDGAILIFGCPVVGWIEGAPKLLKVLKKRLPEDIPVIANLIGPGEDLEGWAEGARRYEDIGADLIELNFSSPGGLMMKWTLQAYEERKLPPTYAGVLVELCEKSATITEAVTKAVKVPVGVKWSPESSFPPIVSLTKQVRDVGARFVTSLNMASGFAPPDIYNGGRPTWPYLETHPAGGIAGNWLRHILYKHVANIARFVPEVDIFATGGLVCPEHFVEAIMLGAKATGTCSGIFFKGLPLIRKSVKFLTKYMEDQRYDSIEEFRGLALKYISYPEEVDWKIGKLFAEVDPVACDGCGLCTQTLCDASYIEDGVAKVRREDCGGCGICLLTCPHGARKVVCQD